MANLLKHLNKQEKDDLFDAFNYMNMSEIKELCKRYSISASGKKGEILDRLKYFLTTGKILLPEILPEISIAKPGKIYPIAPNTKILKGAYKNNSETRSFFKKLIGENFHFTSFGQDWILKCWQEGRPPTYAKFAKFWQKEYSFRKKSEANPKNEWAYLTFIKKNQKENPKASKRTISKAWEQIRIERVKKAKSMLAKF